MYPVIINQYALHFEIGLLAVLLVLKFDKGVLKALACALLSDNLTRKNFAKSAKNKVEIFVCGLLSVIRSRIRVDQIGVPSVTGLSLHTKSTCSGGLTSAWGKSPSNSNVKA